ncbi:hypothetical protein KM043_018564 [Ampulex compressa]|nr:hypothetical protein KM043_018564 [Ampulex compressa]
MRSLVEAEVFGSKRILKMLDVAKEKLSLNKESDQCNEIKTLCSKIFADFLEKFWLNIFQYMDPILILEHTIQDRELLKSIEQSRRYIKNYPDLKNDQRLEEYSKINTVIYLQLAD